MRINELSNDLSVTCHDHNTVVLVAHGGEQILHLMFCGSQGRMMGIVAVSNICDGGMFVLADLTSDDMIPDNQVLPQVMILIGTWAKNLGINPHKLIDAANQIIDYYHM